MTKKITLILLALIIYAGCAQAYSGSGTSSSPFVIESYSDFVTLMKSSYATSSTGYYFALSCDIQLAGYSNWEPAGTLSTPFTGHFDGQGHTIYVNINLLPVTIDNYKKLTYDRSLFGVVSSNGDAITNLTVEGVVYGYNAGGLVSILQAGTISGCAFSGDVIAQTSPAGDEAMSELILELADDNILDANGVEILDDADTKTIEYGKINAGGIVAVMLGGVIEDCTSRGNFIASADATPASSGGIVGRMISDSESITGCYVEGDSIISASTVSNSFTVFAMAGGIAGYANTQLDSTISECIFDGIVNSTYYAGGIAGLVRGTILSENTITSTARITGSYSAGGIAGYMASGGWAVSNDVESGAAVSAETYSAGGIIGLLESSGRAVENNNSDATISGQASYKGGIVGALGNNTYAAAAIGSGNTYTGASSAIGRDEWGEASDGGDTSTYYIASTSFTGAVVGEAFTGTLALNATPTASVTWTYSNLPSGMTATSAGSFSFTAPSAGTYTFTAGAYITGYGATDSADITITATVDGSTPSTPSNLRIATSSLKTATQDVYYSTYITAAGISTYDSVAWEVSDGNLPAGLTLGNSTAYATRGFLSGTPTVSGRYTFTVSVTVVDSGDISTATKEFTLYIASSQLTVSTNELPDATIRRSYSADIDAYFPAGVSSSDALTAKRAYRMNTR